MQIRHLIVPALLCGSIPLVAQTAASDTLKIQKAEASSSAFVDAASDSRPREISLGLPTNTVGSVPIFEDGLPVSYYNFQLYPYKSWHGGVSAISSGSMAPMQTAMRYGEIGYYVDGQNRTGSERFEGRASYSLNQYGQHKVDLNLTGPLARGWQYSLSTYQNFDRASNHIALYRYHDRHQFYKGALSKLFANGKGNMSLVYQYVNYLMILENFGPFVYHTDGSVDPFEGFNLGHDSYLPADKEMTYMDLETGEIKQQSFTDGNRDKTHHATYRLDYTFDNGMQLTVRSRLKVGHSYRSNRNLSSTDLVDASRGYTYADGTPFSGYLQRRHLMHFDAFETSWMNHAELSKQTGVHDWSFGLDFHHNHGGTTTSSAALAHEAKADPKLLYYKGDPYYNFNTSGEFYTGYENKAAVYAHDDWHAHDRLALEGFIRLEYLHLNGHNAAVLPGEETNKRHSGFSLKEGKLTPFEADFLNGSLGLNLNYKLLRGLSAIGEYVMTRQHTTLFNYGSSVMPSTKPSDTHLVRAGLSLQNSWLNLVSQMVYIQQNNKNMRGNFNHVLTAPAHGMPAGYTETVQRTAVYGVASLGWTTDAIVSPFSGFDVHLLFTLRNPQYRNFSFAPTFSDGVTEQYDFSGNNITNLHKLELSIDPSYTFGDWRVWAQVRYISKRYINKTNSLFFKGRWETFAGVDYNLSAKVKLSLNVINLLNQKGVSGLIDSADLVEDASGYENYVMAGTFIRPFTVELGCKVEF